MYLALIIVSAGVPENRGDLFVEAATERLPGRRQPQAKRDRLPPSVTEGEQSQDGDTRETKWWQTALSHHRGRGSSAGDSTAINSSMAFKEGRVNKIDTEC